ncbi:hypothetical protein Tco_0275785 [Tanacetum coccineum]
MIDYSLWEVIENGNAHPITKVVETTIAPVTAEEKAQRRLELKVRRTLLMGFPNEHQLKFNSIKDAKSLLQAVKKSSKVLDQTFDRLQKLISQLEIHGESISQEDVNQNTNGAVNTAHGVTTTSTQATSVNSTTIDNLSDVVIYAFFASQPNDGYANNEGKEILESLLLMCRAPRNQKTRNRENTRRVVPIETTTSNALMFCDGAGYDWSDQAEEEQNEQLLKDLRTSKLNNITYKMDLESIEARLLIYKKNKSVYKEDIKVLKCKIHLREVAFTELRRKLELAQKQKDEIQVTVEKLENSSKSLSKLIDYQIVDKCKTGLGYNAVPPPYTGNFIPPKLDFSFYSLEEFMNEPIVSEPTVKKSVVETSEAKTSKAKPKVVRKNNGAPIIEDWVFDSEEEDVPQAKI